MSFYKMKQKIIPNKIQVFKEKQKCMRHPYVKHSKPMSHLNTQTGFPQKA